MSDVVESPLPGVNIRFVLCSFCKLILNMFREVSVVKNNWTSPVEYPVNNM
jgi:hypothetical protein